MEKYLVETIASMVLWLSQGNIRSVMVPTKTRGGNAGECDVSSLPEDSSVGVGACCMWDWY